jgi:hypothetical protein
VIGTGGIARTFAAGKQVLVETPSTMNATQARAVTGGTCRRGRIPARCRPESAERVNRQEFAIEPDRPESAKMMFNAPQREFRR